MLSREGRPARIPPDVSCIAAASAPAVPALPTSVRSQRPNGGSFQVVSDGIWVFLSKKMQTQPPFVFVAAAAASCCSSAHYDSLCAQGESWRLEFRVKTVVGSAAAILMYGRSLGADHILRGVR